MSKAGIIPVGVSVLIFPDQVDGTYGESGIVRATEAKLEQEQMCQTDGVVIDIGPMAFYDEKTPRCKIGDRVIMAAYAGMIRKGKDGLSYRLIKDNDVIGILEELDNE